MLAEGVFYLETPKGVFMTEQTKKKWGMVQRFVPVFLAVLALAFLFAPMFTLYFKDKSVEPTLKWNESVNIIDYLKNFQPLHFTFILFLVFVVIGIIFAIIYDKNKTFGFISIMSLILGLSLFIMQSGFYVYNNVHAYNEAKLAWGGIVTSVLLAFSILTEFIVSYRKNQMTIRDIAEDGMLIAMALILNFIKIPIGATGGSINLQMLPLFLIALRHGPLQGFIASGIIYGFISCLADVYPLSCYPFDYLIGFGGTAAIGIFSNLILKDKTDYNASGELFIFLGGVLGTLIRWFGSTLSSVINYGTTFTEGLAYNIIYVLPSGLITTVILMVLYGPIIKVNNFANKSKTVSQDNE